MVERSSKRERQRDRYPYSPGRNSIVVSTPRCGRGNPGSNPGCGTFFFHFFCIDKCETRPGLGGFRQVTFKTKLTHKNLIWHRQE
jgi:hypothetical protein